MQTKSFVTVSDMTSVAFRVKDELPASHTITRRFRGARFRRAVEQYAALLYRVDIGRLNEIEDFESVEKLTQFVIDTIELHVTLTYRVQDTVECSVFHQLIEKLRIGLEGLQQGLPPDPANRPTEEQLEQLANDRLSEVLPVDAPRRARALA